MSYRFNAAAIGLAIAAVAPTTAADAGPLSSWYGRYVWEESIGRMGGSTPEEGFAAFVTRTLSLGPDNGETGCTLNGEGFQTNTRILCTATPQGESVIIRFYRFGAENRFGSYKAGAPLFTMTRTQRGITTRLQGLTASSDATPSSGVLFRRAR